MISLARILHDSIIQNKNSVAFSCNGIEYNYLQLAQRVAYIQKLIQNQVQTSSAIGIIANQDFDTYCTIVACILSGKTYVPIEKSHPDERNNHILQISDIDTIYCSDISDLTRNFHTDHSCKFILTPKGEANETDLMSTATGNPVYILFTSGSTGLPKGVPISSSNLQAFVDNVFGMGLKITPQSKFLQVFDLTFDLSVFSFLIPLLKGASVYLQPRSALKYIQAIQLIKNENITHILTVPSFIHPLRKYFSEIDLPSVEHWLFCGEALKTEMVAAWQKCLPNATLYNVYGPTEATIFCSSYVCKYGFLKEQNGIVCIGKPFQGTIFELHEDNKTTTTKNEPGELFISGLQLTSGYIKNIEKNKATFSDLNGELFYHSGDICRRDEEGDFFFIGRNDSQVKIQGFRVELGEIEYHASQMPGIDETVVLALMKGNQPSLHLFYSSQASLLETDIKSYLASKLPPYMIPSVYIHLQEFPYNVNGKIDKLALQLTYS